MSDPIGSSDNKSIRPAYFSAKKTMAQIGVDRALGEIAKDPKVDAKIQKLAFTRSVGAGYQASTQAAKKLEAFTGSKAAQSSGSWFAKGASKLFSGVSSLATGGAQPGDYGSKVQSEFSNNPELNGLVTGMTRLGAASAAVNKGTPPKSSTDLSRDDVMTSLAMLGRGEKPSAKSISSFMNTQRDKINGADQLSDSRKGQYLSKLDGQEQKALDVLTLSKDKQVDVSPGVLQNSMRLDPDFTSSFHPQKPLAELSKEYLTQRTETAVKDGFPEDATSPEDIKFSSDNFDPLMASYNQETLDAAQGIEIALEPFEEKDGGLSDVARIMVEKGMDEEISLAQEENVDLQKEFLDNN